MRVVRHACKGVPSCEQMAGWAREFAKLVSITARHVHYHNRPCRSCVWHGRDVHSSRAMVYHQQQEDQSDFIAMTHICPRGIAKSCRQRPRVKQGRAEMHMSTYIDRAHVLHPSVLFRNSDSIARHLRQKAQQKARVMSDARFKPLRVRVEL